MVRPPGRRGSGLSESLAAAPCPQALASPVMTQPNSSLGVAGRHCVPDSHCFHSRSLLRPPRLTPAPAWQSQVQTQGTQGQECVEKCSWPMAVRVLFPDRGREDDLEVQVVTSLIRRHHCLGSDTVITFNCVQPFFLVPQGFTLPCPVSSSKSPWKLIPSRKSSLAQMSWVQILCKLVAILLPGYRITPTLSSVRAWTLAL